jgi:DNA-directed RNA polymerase specialized sigma24 family protein
MRRASQRMGEKDREVIRDLYSSLCRFAAIVAPPETEPEDLVQEALCRALRRGRLADLEHPTAYLRRAILNLVANEARRAGRMRRAFTRLGAPEGFDDSYPSDVQDLLSLPPQARAVVFMREVEGRTYAEIAAAVGCREATARATATRALHRLRELLSQEAQDATA